MKLRSPRLRNIAEALGFAPSGSTALHTISAGITSWPVAGLSNAPTPASNVRVYGVDTDGAADGQVYFWNGTSWLIMTDVTHATFLGG